MKKALLVLGGTAAAVSTASATMITDATDAIADNVTGATTIGGAIIGLAAVIGLIGLVKGMVKRH